MWFIVFSQHKDILVGRIKSEMVITLVGLVDNKDLKENASLVLSLHVEPYGCLSHRAQCSLKLCLH